MLIRYLLSLLVFLGSNYALMPKLTLDDFFNYTEFSSLVLAPDDGKSILIETRVHVWNQSVNEMHLHWQSLPDGTRKLITTRSSADLKPIWKGEWIAYVLESQSRSRADRSLKQDEQFMHLYSILTEQTYSIRLGKESIHAITWSNMTETIYFAARTSWTTEADEAYSKLWHDVIQYREEERGDTIYRINMKNMTNITIDIVANISMRVDEIICSSDGRRLIFSTTSRSDRMESMDDFEIYQLDLASDSPKTALRLTHNTAEETNLRWSTDNLIFFTVTEYGSVGAVHQDTQGRLYSLNTTNGDIVRWANQFEGNVEEFALLKNGLDGVVILGQLGTEVQVYSQKSPNAPLIKHLGWNGTYEKIGTVLSDIYSTIAFVHSSFDTPQEIYFAHDIDKLMEANKITNENDFFTQRSLPKGATYRWVNEDDKTEIEGVLWYPPEQYQEKNLPLLVLIHGGPYDADLNAFRADWYSCAIMMATSGWLVLQPNYRGSTGYGDNFLNGVRLQILSRPGKDILFGVDALVRDGIADPMKLAIGGFSYGGYLTNWLITQTTRFNVALTGAGAVENIIDWGTNDMPTINAYFLGGFPWEQPDRYHEEAAIYRMSKVCTPTHIVTGEDDIRVPAAENYLLERALNVLEVPTKLLIFPGDGHIIESNPWHEKIKLREELSWLQKYGTIRPSSCNRTTNSSTNKMHRNQCNLVYVTLFLLASFLQQIYI